MASEVGRLARLANSFRRPRTSPPADAPFEARGRATIESARRPPSDSDRQPPGLTAAVEDVLVKVVAGPQLHCRTRATRWSAPRHGLYAGRGAGSADPRHA